MRSLNEDIQSPVWDLYLGPSMGASHLIVTFNIRLLVVAKLF
jgi:hypothetical protein